MKHLFYITLLFFVLKIQGQNMTEKSFSSEGISALVVDGDLMFKIRVKTAKTNTILVRSLVEGEHNEQVVLITEIKNNQLQISSKYQPLFIADNDKLSAHKAISIELEMVVPENLDVQVSSSMASVFVSGTYHQFVSELKSGSFQAEGFQGNLLVNTIHGHIKVASNKAKLTVSSKYGEVKEARIETGNNLIKLNSINGNITVTKTE